MSEFTTTVNGHLKIVGRINTQHNLRGNIGGSNALSGVMSTRGNMVGMMFSELYMNGLLNNPLKLKGSMRATQHLRGFAAHKKDGTIITGEVDFVTYYTGSSTPSSSLGVNGDIYLQE